MRPAHAIDCVRRFPNQAIMKSGIVLPAANCRVKIVAPARPIKKLTRPPQ